jgi:ABC-2 type transport system permease protein
MTIIPIVLTPFMIPGNRSTLIAEGYTHANGAEQAVPGFAILFSFFSVQLIVQMFFNEQHWGTWTRLRLSSASMADIIIGKAGVAFILQLLQTGVVLLAGSVICDYHPNGSLLALIVTAVVFSAALSLFGVCISLWCSSEHTALSIAMLAGILMACIGGALTPVSTFPAWAKPLARISAAYWVVDAIKITGLDHGTIRNIIPNLAFVTAFAAACLFLVALRSVKLCNTRTHRDQCQGRDGLVQHHHPPVHRV